MSGANHIGSRWAAIRPTHVRRVLPWLRKRVLRFRRNESGSMLVFSLMIFTTMLLAGGMAVDFMRFEATRSRIQATLDRAVLAAASLRQPLDPEAVVVDFMSRAGFDGYTLDVDVTEGLNFRVVEATASLPQNAIFLNIVGFRTLNVRATSSAEERVPNVEVSLVLDISGSMRFTDSSGVPQINIMRPAARRFVQQMLAGDRADLTTISIIPYAGHVNPGQRVFELLGGEAWHGFSHCMELTSSDFSQTGLPQGSNRDQVPNFMWWAIDWNWMEWGWCPSSAAEIQYFSADVNQLTNFINTMSLHDGTGTHYGMRWGLALLDPSSRWLANTLVSDGTVAASIGNRPANWDDAETLKVLVLMTDGEITDQYRPRFPEDEINNSVHLLAQNSNRRQTLSSRTTNRNQFWQSCDLAKQNGVTVFTIAFNTSSRAANEMRQCASSPSHFYEARSHQLDAAFQSIAGAIQMLKLTQ
ncbi:MAG: hypothetical protein JJU40_04455 [Rhodobacteraceae bacterium]|nr:hypothetical protein [Paracoccaceae bacterium]